MYALVIACQGVYRATDTARYFGLTPAEVRRIWNSGMEVDEVEPPNIDDCRPTMELIRRDVQILAWYRGMNYREIALTLGICTDTVGRILGDA